MILGLLTFFALLYLPGLGSYGLFDPWETHYGEVARNMVEAGNYIDPFWGSPFDEAGVSRERAGFYSKPPLTMWMMAAGMKVWGHNTLGVRFFFPLLAIAALLSIYLVFSRLMSRRVGFLSVLLCGLSPFFSFISRQAVTDGPLLSLVTIGFMSVFLALFHASEERRGSPALYGLVLLVSAVAIFGQLWVIWPMDRSPDALRAYQGEHLWFRFQWWLMEAAKVGRGKGWVIATLLGPAALWLFWRISKIRSQRGLYLCLFYLCCALTVSAKGWLGWAPLGGAIFLFLLVTGEWKTLRQVNAGFGILLVLLVSHIWVLAMLGGHGGWAKRFIIHDHINRLFAGVHSTDSGAFEYFFQWIGYGLFPAIALLPAGIARVLGRLRRGPQGFEPRQKIELLLFLWALFSFFLFSKSSTKFHHYILPAIPPLSILSALWLDELVRRRARSARLLIFAAMGILLWVGQDVVRAPAAYGQSSQNWVNLFTYKYDREWPIPKNAEEMAQIEKNAVRDAWLKNFHLPLPGEIENCSTTLMKAADGQRMLDEFARPVQLVLGLALLGLLVMLFGRGGALGASILLVACTVQVAFGLHRYLPRIEPHWGQETLWDVYYEDCSKFPDTPEGEAAFRKRLLTTASRIPQRLDLYPRARCREPIVAFRMNWRGETFYSGNTVVPLLYTKDMKPWLKRLGVWERWDPSQTFYIFTERNRIRSELEPSLPRYLKGQYREIFGVNRDFVLLKVGPEEKRLADREAQQVCRPRR